MLGSQNKSESILFDQTLKEIVENWYNFFLKCLVEFTSETYGSGTHRFIFLQKTHLLAKTFNTMLNRSGEIGHSCLVLDL